MKHWSEDKVASHLDFSCGGLFGQNPSLVQLQQKGVTRVCNILRKKEGVAYLADEVGLGKTMQALGVISCLFVDHPKARVLVITPREVVQNGWKNEYCRFTRYVAKASMPDLSHFDNLRDWLRTLPGDRSVSLLRHPSFSRPVFRSDIDWRHAVKNLNLPEIRFRNFVSTSSQNASWDYNLAFAKDVNEGLKRDGTRFDLVVVDEAQCLRNLDGQQTNSVLRQLLRGQVDRWLFLSATPAHSGIANIATVMNEYASTGPLIPIGNNQAENTKKIQLALKHYMIRRPRTFTIAGRELNKREYRLDDDTSLALHCNGTLDTLSIALVQKHLVGILGQGQGYRFRTGYIASFESLDDSLKYRIPPQVASTEADDEDSPSSGTDFVGERHVRSDSGQAPDEGFVTQISREFFDRFDIALPHPKIDGVEKELAKAAWGTGTADIPGGIKTVVFCRRLSSVRILRERLMKRYLRDIEKRCQTVWKFSLDWDRGLTPLAGGAPKADLAASEDGNATLEEVDEVQDDNLNRLRAAQRPGKWLFNFRSSFTDGQRNWFFFELNWFRWLCAIGGVDPEVAANKVPDDLWRESFAAATHSEKRYRREQARFLAWRCLERYAQQIFQLEPAFADKLAEALRPILYGEQASARAANATNAGAVNRDTELLLFESLWTKVEALNLLRLPAAGGFPDIESVQWRKIVATVLSQYTRLSDALVDLRCCEMSDGNKSSAMPEVFVKWLSAGSADALRLLQVWRDWCEHYRLIFSSAVGDLLESQDPKQLASQNSFSFLTNIDPVVGVAGGSGGHKLAVCLFNTPGMPYVMVGTDTIREGVNLHLFCDRVMHYGLPWTAGDLEQRVGRVDRYFGRIERRLHLEGLGARLEITYPYLRDTIEGRQIESLRLRRREVDALRIDDICAFDPDEGQFIEFDTPLRAPKKSM